MDSVTTYWKNLTQCARLPQRTYDGPGWYDHGTLASYVKIEPNEKKKIRFVFSWNTPNQYNYWKPCKDENGEDILWKNYYATRFETSKQSGAYAFGGLMSY